MNGSKSREAEAKNHAILEVNVVDEIESELSEVRPRPHINIFF